MIDLSIIIPTKNRLWALPQAVQSCRDSGLNVEIIVVDDGSTDGTREWLSDQNNIIHIRLEGWGKPYAVNRALQTARGEFVRILDSDDWFPEGTLLEQVSLARIKQVDVVVAGYREVDHDAKVIRDRPWIPCDDFISQQLGECDSSHYSAFTFRTDYVREIPHRSNFPSPQFATRDDRCFMLEVALKKPKYAIAESMGLCHRHHRHDRLQKVAGLSAIAANLNLILVYQHVLRILTENGELTKRRQIAAGRILAQAGCWISDYHLLSSMTVTDYASSLNAESIDVIEKNSGVLASLLGLKNFLRLRHLRRTIITFMRSFRAMPASITDNWLK